MRTSLILAISASMIAAPVLAQGHSGGGGGGGGGMGAAGSMGAPGGMNAGGGMSAMLPSTMQNPGMDVRTDARANAQGPLNANQQALDHANQNSVLSNTTTSTDATTGAGVTSRDKGRLNAQGDEHASTTAKTKADANSELATTSSTKHSKKHKPH